MTKIILLIVLSTYHILDVQCNVPLPPELQKHINDLTSTSKTNFGKTDLNKDTKLVEEEVMAIFKGVAGNIYKQDFLTYAQYSKHFAPDENMETSQVSQYFFDSLDTNNNYVIDTCDMKNFFKKLDKDGSNDVTMTEYVTHHLGLAHALMSRGAQNAVQLAACNA